jgi:hypothetical protein
MIQPGAILSLLAEAHVEFHMDWTRLALTLTIFVALAGGALYLEMRGVKSKKQK